MGTPSRIRYSRPVLGETSSMTKARPDQLREILGVVEASLADPGLTGDQLALRAYLSRSHFDRLVTADLREP